jgi:uncharacterized protein YbjQ (UPF0145 family)
MVARQMVFSNLQIRKKAYNKVCEKLKDEASEIKADAIVGAHFDYRVAAKTGCFSGQAFEVIAYGTAVKFS